MKPSTRAWIREARQMKNYTFFDLVHGYIYTRFPYFYISVGTGEHKLSKTIGPIATKIINLLTPHKNGKDAPNLPEGVTEAGLAFANTYHGKVVPLEAAKQLVSIKQEIRITELEKIIPYTRARDIIMHNPDHIVALDCPCRSARERPCLPLDVCLIIGEPFASFVVEHHPKKTRWITSDEATGILKAENERGHVHHAFFKDAELGRFYAICNCCDCCCGAMQAQRSGTPMLISSGYRAEVNTDKCFGCGTCSTFCQFHAIHVCAAGYSEIDAAKCMGCGICVNHCEHQALSLVRDPAKGEPLEIQKLMEMSTL